MAIPILSKLVSVDVKKVWPLEATSFTPWLLANADVLGDVLRMDIHLEKAEHKVGGFSLDLIGQDQDSETVVIVENQFGPTDHRHLGQLLTYAGGTSPATIVWIAESFRDEHRAALDWLNARTDSETRFFGVQVGAVTLDGAPVDLVAPHFEVVVKPNDWGKEVKKATVEASSDRELLYQEFWTKWLEQVVPRHWTNRKAPAKHWMHIPAGTTKARYSVSFRSNGMLSELYFNHPDARVNLARWQQLAAKKNLIEQHFGGPLTFDQLPQRIGCRMGVERTGGESVDDGDAWPEYLAWFEDTQTRLRAAVAAVGGIPPLPELAEAATAGEDEDLEEE